MAAINKIPEGIHTVTPYMTIKDAAQALEFYKKAFNAKEIMRFNGDDGLIIHAEFQIGDSRIMLSDEMPNFNAKGPLAYGGSPMCIMLYVEDVDALFKQAISAGATEEMAIANQFYGDRSGSLKDPFGYTWTISTHVEDVPFEEMNKRMEKMKSERTAQS